MKRRMCVSRCCCLDCAAGETSWSDNFLSYSSGEDVTPYGYVSDPSGAAIESSGGVKPDGNSTGNDRVSRLSPFQWSSFTNLQFELQFIGSELSGSMGLLTTVNFSQYFAGIYWLSSNVVTISWPTSGGLFGSQNYTRSWATNDTFKVSLDVTGVTVLTEPNIAVDHTTEFFHNGVSFATKSGTAVNSRSNWCASYYGSTRECTTSNWEFSAT